MVVIKAAKHNSPALVLWATKPTPTANKPAQLKAEILRLVGASHKLLKPMRKKVYDAMTAQGWATTESIEDKSGLMDFTLNTRKVAFYLYKESGGKYRAIFKEGSDVKETVENATVDGLISIVETKL